MTETTPRFELRLNPQIVYLIAVQYGRMTTKAPQKGLGCEEPVRKVRWNGASWSVGSHREVADGHTKAYVVLTEERDGKKTSHRLAVDDLHDGILCSL